MFVCSEFYQKTFDAVYDTTLTAFSILQTLCCPESLPSFRSFQNFYKQLFTVLGKQRLLCGPICSLWLGTPKNCLRSVQCHMIIFLLSITRNYLCIIKFCGKKNLRICICQWILNANIESKNDFQNSVFSCFYGNTKSNQCDYGDISAMYREWGVGDCCLVSHHPTEFRAANH